MNKLYHYTKQSILLLFLFSMFFIESCEKLKEKPVIQITSSKINEDGSVSISAKVVSGKKNVASAGFCLGKNSLPEADIYSSALANTLVSNFVNDQFAEQIPADYFESYTGYYIRPYVKSNSGIVYGEQVYFQKIQAPAVTVPCTLTDNEINIGSTTGTEHFTTVQMTPGSLSEYRVRAISNSHIFTLEFQHKPRTGVYVTGFTGKQNEVEISFISGFISGSAKDGSAVYVNEVEKDKFEISLCSIPWKYGNNTFQMTSKIIVD